MTSPYPTPDVELQDVRFQLHIHEAVAIVAKDAHAVLDIVLNAADPAAAHSALADRYGFTDAQTRAVTDVQFGRLTSSELDHIERRRRQIGRRIEVLVKELGGA